MGYLKRLWRNALSSYQLKEEYFKFTSRVGLVIVFCGLGLMLYGMALLISLLGIDTSIPLNQWKYGSGFLTVVLLPVFFIFCLIPSVLIIAGLTSIYLVSKGEISIEQAKKYTLLGEYPRHWFKNT